MAAEDRERLGHSVDAGHDTIDEVRTVEDAHEHGRGPQAELPGDVVADAWRGRGREGVKAGLGKSLPEQGQLPILRAEVVAPLADAMGLVDREPLHAHLRERVE